MDWTQVLALMGAVFIANMGVIIPMFLWVRSEANADRKEFNAIQREDRKDLLQISKNLETALQGIQQEMRDFHNRLCSIEERKNKGA